MKHTGYRFTTRWPGMHSFVNIINKGELKIWTIWFWVKRRNEKSINFWMPWKISTQTKQSSKKKHDYGQSPLFSRHCSWGYSSYSLKTQHRLSYQKLWFRTCSGQNTAWEKLTNDKEHAVKFLEVDSEALRDIEDEPKFFADVAMKRLYENQKSVKKKYMDVRFVCSSSNQCEKRFSAEERAYSDLRKTTTPYHMECVISL